MKSCFRKYLFLKISKYFFQNFMQITLVTLVNKRANLLDKEFAGP